MPTFNYKAVSDKGESTTGTIDAPDRKAVQSRLLARKLRATEITIKGAASSAAVASARDSASISFDGPQKKTAVKAGASRYAPTSKILEPEEFKGEKHALAFLKKLHQLHGGGMPLGDSIRLLSVRVQDPRQSSIAARLWKDISEGRTLANAMRGYPKSFDSSMTHLIEAGEGTGNLVPVLENLINHLEERAELQKKIMGGLAYPIFICTLAFGVVLLFLFFLLPQIRKMMASMGGQLNFMTTILIGMSESAVKYGPFVMIFLAIFAAVIANWRQKPEGRAKTDAWLLRLPMLKRIFLNSDICRISNLCATLMESGLNTTETLRMTEKSIKNVVVQSRFSAARTLINDGASFSNAFRHYHVLPELDLDMLAVGENTGNIGKSFREIYRIHSRELSAQFQLMTVVISSSALGFAFLLVAVLVLSIVSSVLQMAKSINGHH